MTPGEADSTTDPAVEGTRAPSYRDTIQIPAVESPFMEEMLGGAGLSPELEETVRSLARDGYCVIDPGLPDLAERAARIDADLGGKYGADRRVSEAWYWNQDVRDIANAPAVLEFLELVYQRDPIPFQTLNFEVGTEQPSHSDTIHFHSLPRHYMCGAWVALEDVHPDAGPLVVHPGSHVLPDYEMQDIGVSCEPEDYHHYEAFIRDMLEAKGYPGKELLLEKGQCAIWLANLYHGGTGIKDPQRTRKSQVTHYYFEDCQYFFPMQSDLPAGRITRREVIDLRDGSFVTHRYRGQDVDLGDIRKVCTYPRPLPKFVR
jgi:hypothetical protein